VQKYWKKKKGNVGAWSKLMGVKEVDWVDWVE
jgi:hypothetical protein